METYAVGEVLGVFAGGLAQEDLFLGDFGGGVLLAHRVHLGSPGYFEGVGLAFGLEGASLILVILFGAGLHFLGFLDLLESLYLIELPIEHDPIILLDQRGELQFLKKLHLLLDRKHDLVLTELVILGVDVLSIVVP